jgi:protein-L-isoaspartate(D-aspartate) O-methyltransferase
MTETLDLRPHHRVYELGTGSGYQAAVLAEIVDEVYTVEIVSELARRARTTLEELDYENVHVRAGDGWAGWPEAAPFDRIIVTAAAPELPQILLDQLVAGGKMILPLGPDGGAQELILVEKTEDGRVKTRELLPVRFVPVTRDPR